MKPKFRSFLLLASTSLLAISYAHAADGTWKGNSGAWSDTTNDPDPLIGVWVDGIVADGTNSTANFTGVNIAAAQTINLTDIGRTIGNITFTDLTTSSHDLTISGANALTLDVTTGTPIIDVTQSGRTLTISSEISGSDGLQKNGAGTLVLGSTTSSSLSGNINIAAGALSARFSALGSGNLVFTGNSSFTKIYSSPNAATNGFTVNDGVTATIGGSTFYYNFATTGALVGNSSAKLVISSGGNTQKDFNSTSNTFAGDLTLGGGGTADNGQRTGFKSLADSGQKIIINDALFRLNSGGVSMNFANRVLEMTSNARLDNDSTSSSVTLSFAQDLSVKTGNNARLLTLSGVNTGDNTFSGVIGNSSTGTGKVSVTKSEAGTWILGGANTYTGVTTVSGGTLTLGVDDCLADTSNVAIGAGTLNAADSVNDTAGTLDVTNAASKINLGSGATLAFADSNAVDWAGGALDITGTFVEASSLRFGTTSGGLTSTQLSLITLNGSPTSCTLDINGYLVTGAPVDPYTTWSGGLPFNVDTNNDGVSNGLAFLLGASGPGVSALDKLPTVTETSGGLVLNFSMRNAANRGTAALSVEHSSDLGISDAWEAALVPDSDTTVSDVVFDITAGNPLNGVVATIPVGKAAAGKLFGRLKVTE